MLLCAFALTQFATAQCGLTRMPSTGIPGTNGTIYAAVRHDLDGAGPEAPVVVLGGSFTVIGTTAAGGLATYDSVTGAIAPLGGPGPHNVRALLVTQNGDLLAASQTPTAGFVVERWNGATWAQLGQTFDAPIRALAELQNGDVVAAGDFTGISGTPLPSIARWNGTSWQSMGSGADASVYALAVLPNGDLVAGGGFQTIGGVATTGLARWNGSGWVSFGVLDFGVLAMLVASNGDLVIGGTFRTIGGSPATGLARWNGSTFTAISLPAPVHAIAEASNGDLVVGGEFTTPGVRVARWDGTSWSPLAAGLGAVPRALAFGADGTLVAAGSFTGLNGVSALGVARFGQGVWSPLCGGFSGPLVAIAAHPEGGFVMSGQVGSIDGVPMPALVRFDGTLFVPFAPGTATLSDPMRVLPNGDLVGRDGSGRLVRVNASSRTQLDPPVAAISDLDVDPQQRLVVVGPQPGFATSQMWRLDSSVWSPIGGGLAGSLPALVAMPNGDYVVGGSFPDVGGAPIAYVARWVGNVFVPLGSGLNGPVTNLVLRQDGRLLVLGTFTMAGGVAANGVAWWDGVSWSAEPGLENIVFTRPKFLPDGSLIVRTSSGSQRWDGVQWTSLGDSSVILSGTSEGTAVLTNGDYVLAAVFQTSAGAAANNLVRFQSSCRALATPVGAGCLGQSLQTTSAAWAAGVCRVRGVGLGAAQLVLVGTGFAPQAVGLDTLLPQGVAGCSLLVVADSSLTQLAFANGGVAESSLSIPRDPVLVGAAFRQQMVPVQFDGIGALVAVTSTNAVDHVVGSY